MMIPRRTFTMSLLAASLAGACSSTPMTPTPSPASPPPPFDPERGYQRREVSAGGRTVVVRAWEGLAYVSRPVEPQWQVMNLYIPEAYFQDGQIDGRTARTAPIFLPNSIGGYMPAKPGTPEGRNGPPPAPGQTPTPSAIAVALTRGLVVASPGARGRTLQAADGTWTGKAPAAIVDLKAAVRFLRHHDAVMPGDTARIISNGTSAGGALSALLGASGNSPDHEEALRALGAAPARDDIFAVSAYCPITNLENADAAYEWQFGHAHDYRRIEMSMLDYQVQRREVAGTLTADQIALADALKASFPAYLNTLDLRDAAGRPLRLDAHGHGSFLDHVKSLVIASAQQALDAGADLSSRRWLRIASGRVVDLDFDAYGLAATRMKLPPAFDGVALDTGENQLFGSSRLDKRHFTAFSMQHSRVVGAQQADERTVRMMNPMHYIGRSAATVAPHWRIRHGTMDRDTSLAVPVMLGTLLAQHGIDMDLALPWDRPHSGDYDLDALFAWIDRVTAVAR
ncbi:subtype B tannase [Sphaerotilus natans]|uniref:subtype B tannase n=1 Tax=Sphaerotilus natans TaxID=34103 RepID=UPI00406D495A